MAINKRSSISEHLRKFCHYAKEDDYIEVTDWTNGEGFDIDLDGKQQIRLTHGELRAINTLVGMLEAGIDNKG